MKRLLIFNEFASVAIILLKELSSFPKKFSKYLNNFMKYKVHKFLYTVSID